MKYKVGNEVIVTSVGNDVPEYSKGCKYKILQAFNEEQEYYKLSNFYFYDVSQLALENELKLVPRRTRGFEAVAGFSPELPQRATKHSAGYDIRLIEDLYLAIGETVVVPTGLKAYMQADEVLKIYIRSSMGTKHKLSLANSTGVIDADFYNNEDNEGHFVLAIVNNSGEPKYFPKGTKVAQGIFEKYLLVDNDECTEERIGGIGSSGLS